MYHGFKQLQEHVQHRGGREPWKHRATLCQSLLTGASCLPFALLYHLHKIKHRELWTRKNQQIIVIHIRNGPTSILGLLLQGNDSQCVEISPMTVKQTAIYNTGHELYAILRLISCYCSENSIDLNLQNEPIRRKWFSFNSWCKLRTLYFLIDSSY